MDMNKFLAGLRVLAVDDDCTSLSVLKRLLQLCNYNNVTTVMEAETALDMLRERKDRDDQFDLVISDVFMPDIDGFKLLELIGLEMDIPVIMLSANDEMDIMMKGIKNGACDYLVKPACMDHIRNIWKHVVRKDRTDLRNSVTDGKKSAHHTKHSKKNKKDGDGAEKDKEGTSTQKRQRIKWSGQLHRKFVEAINQIGMDRAVPKNILEVMNVDGLSRDNVASHLQKYRIYLRKLSEGTLSHSNPFVDEPQAWLSDTTANMNGPNSSQDHLELVQPSPSSIGTSSSSNGFARISCPSAFGTHNLQQDTEPVGNGVNLPTNVVPVSVPVQDVSRSIFSGRSYGTVSIGGLSSASQCFPSGPSSSSSGNISNGVVFNTSRPFSSGTSGNSFANISNDSSPSTTSMHFPSTRSCSSYASILRRKMLDANRGIPFDADSFFEEIAGGEMPALPSYLALQSPELANQHSIQIQPSSTGLFNQVAPSSHHLPSHSSELVNQPSIQIQPSPTGHFNKVARESHQFAGLCNPSNSWSVGVQSRFPDVGHSAGTSIINSSQGSSARINQTSRFVASSGDVPTFGSEYQNQMAGLSGRTTPMLGFSGQVAPFNFGISAMSVGSSALGSSSSVGPALANHHIGNSFLPTQMLSDRGSSGNFLGGGTVDQQAIGDQVSNNNEHPTGRSEAQDGAMIDDLDDFLADWVKQ
ncbi:hypothetical protein SETIT_4G198600v2 [Setaria italica]|nr:hypothetical protein SETIT_4G198600v2 [Setaria italica]